MYLLLLVVGGGFLLLSVIFGELFDLEGVGLGFMRPTVVAVTVAVTGAVGLLLTRRDVWGIFVLAIAVVCGLFAGFMLHRFVIVPLHKMQNTSSFDKNAMVGSVAKVVSPIPQGGYGKIRYTASGSTVTGPARSDTGSGIKKDADVVIMYIKDNAYYVSEKLDASDILPHAN